MLLLLYEHNNLRQEFLKFIISIKNRVENIEGGEDQTSRPFFMNDLHKQQLVNLNF